MIATVTSATVDETKKVLYIGTDCGHILTRPISEDELTDYRAHRDTFFGIVHEQGKKPNNKYDSYERLVEIHMSHPKDNILNQIKKWRDADELKQLSHEDLVLEYCERLVGSLSLRTKPKA